MDGLTVRRQLYLLRKKKTAVMFITNKEDNRNEVETNQNKIKQECTD